MDSTSTFPDTAASGAEPVDPAIAREDATARAELWNDLLTWANPLPNATEWVDVMRHYSEQAQHADQLWEPVRAIHSNMHLCLSLLEEAMQAAWSSVEIHQEEKQLAQRDPN